MCHNTLQCLNCKVVLNFISPGAFYDDAPPPKKNNNNKNNNKIKINKIK